MGNTARYHRQFLNGVSLLALMFVLICGIPGAYGQGSFTLVFSEGQSLREIADEYLGDPDLWTEILKASDIETVVDVQPGTRLTIPVTAVSRANRQLAETLALIQEATELGARIFVPDDISDALDKYDEALAHRSNGSWDQCYQTARAAAASARRAITASQRFRNMSAAAVLGSNSGTVQGRKQSDLDWSRLAQRAVLVEKQRIRTLANSYADVVFRDESRIRLNQNSQAAIETMEIDLLTNEEKTEVSLIEGDVMALLGGGRAKKEFTLTMPGIEATTDIQSRNFWVGREKESAMVANYDDGEITLTAQGQEVVLQRNRGVTVDQTNGLGEIVTLLPPVRLADPGHNNILFVRVVTLDWEPVEGADRYRLDVARDRMFNDMVVNAQYIRNGATSLPLTLEPGAYFWRVSAIDNLGFPGEASGPRRFLVMVDDLEPYLWIGAPNFGSIHRQPNIGVFGETEVGGEIEINGIAVAVSDNGAFRTTIKIDVGESEITILARDEAGNETTQLIPVRYMPDREPLFRLDEALRSIGDSLIIATSSIANIAGFTDPNSAVRLRSLEGRMLGLSMPNADGRFSFRTLVDGDRQSFYLEIESLSGQISRKSVTVEIDRTGPQIELTSEFDAVTADERVTLSGSVSGATSLTLNGDQIPVSDSRFVVELDLKAGSNVFMLTAHDEDLRTASRQISIFKDAQPPRLVNQRVRVRREGSTRVADVEITVSDESALRRSIPVGIRAGASILKGHVALSDAATSIYHGTVAIPADYTGSVSLQYVELFDYVGNRVLIEF